MAFSVMRSPQIAPVLANSAEDEIGRYPGSIGVPGRFHRSRPD